MALSPDRSARRFAVLTAAFLFIFFGAFTVGRYAVRVDKTVCILLDGALRAVSHARWGLAAFWTDAAFDTTFLNKVYATTRR